LKTLIIYDAEFAFPQTTQHRLEILHTTQGEHAEVTRRNCRQGSGLNFPVDFVLSDAILIAYYGINSRDSFVVTLYLQKAVKFCEIFMILISQ
jgi:hypothetical protein